MPVEAELGGVGEVRAELEEEGTEVPVHAVEVGVVDQRGRAHDPGVAPAGLRVRALLGPEDRRLLLGLAHEEDAFVPREPGQVGPGEVVLALPLAERDERDARGGGERADGRDEGRADGLHQRRGGEGVPPVEPEEGDHPQLVLEPGDVHVQVQPVDALHFQGHMLGEDLGNAARYTHRRLRSLDGRSLGTNDRRVRSTTGGGSTVPRFLPPPEPLRATAAPAPHPPYSSSV